MNLCGCGCGAQVKRKYLSGHQSRCRDITLKNNPHWKGGRYINDSGYVMVYNPSHSRASSNGYVREHLILAEKALGKPIPVGVPIHHHGDVSDNNKIVICQDERYHNLLHIRERAFNESGHANYRKCQFCKQYDRPENLFIRQRDKEGWIVYHRECHRIHSKKQRESKNAITAIPRKDCPVN